MKTEFIEQSQNLEYNTNKEVLVLNQVLKGQVHKEYLEKAMLQKTILPEPTPENKILTLDEKEILNSFFEYTKEKLSAPEYSDILPLYNDLYFSKYKQVLSNDSLPFIPEIVQSFLTENKYNYQSLKKIGLADYDRENKKIIPNIKLAYRLIQHHRDLDGLPLYYTPLLLEAVYNDLIAINWLTATAIISSGKLSFDTCLYLIERIPTYKAVKRLNPPGLAVQPSGIETLNQDTITDSLVCIEESFDKALAIRNTGYTAIGIGGIHQPLDQNQPVINKIKEKGFAVLITFDQRARLNTPEIKAKISLGEKLQALGITVFIGDLPKPCMLSGETLDIDEHLAEFKTTREKKRAWQRIVKKKLTLDEYKAKMKRLKDSQIFRKRKKGYAARINRLYEKLAVQQVRGELTVLYPEFINNFHNIPDSLQHLLATPGGGSGKTYALISLIKSLTLSSRPVIYITSNKNLIKEVLEKAKKAGINDQEVHFIKGITDRCFDTLEKYSDSKEIIKQPDGTYKENQRLEQALSKEYPINKACQTCRLSKQNLDVCKVGDWKEPLFKSGTKLYLMTVDKYMQNTEKILAELNPLAIFVDEAIEGKILKSTELDVHNLLKLRESIQVTNNEDIKKALDMLKIIIDDIQKDKALKIEGEDLYAYFLNYGNFKKLLGEINLGNLNIRLKDEITLEESPDNKLLVEIIRELKKKCSGMMLFKKKLRIAVKREFYISPTIPYVWLNATGNKQLMGKVLKIKASNIQVYSPKIQHNNFFIYQDTSHSYTNSSILSNPNILNSFIDFILSKAKTGKKILVVVGQQLQERLEKYFFPPNVDIEHYFSLRGINDYEHHDIAILTTPPVEYNGFELDAKVLIDDPEIEINRITEKKLSSIVTSDGNNYEDNEIITYTSSLIKELLYIRREHEIYQSLKRIYRNYDPKTAKEIFIFSDLVMADLIFEDITEFKLLETPPQIRKEKEYEILENRILTDGKNKNFVLNYSIDKLRKTDKKTDTLNAVIEAMSQKYSSFYISLKEPSVLLRNLTLEVSKMTFTKWKDEILKKHGFKTYQLKGIKGNYLIYSQSETYPDEADQCFKELYREETPAPIIYDQALLNEMINSSDREVSEMADLSLLEVMMICPTIKLLPDQETPVKSEILKPAIVSFSEWRKSTKYSDKILNYIGQLGKNNEPIPVIIEKVKARFNTTVPEYIFSDTPPRDDVFYDTITCSDASLNEAGTTEPPEKEPETKANLSICHECMNTRLLEVDVRLKTDDKVRLRLCQACLDTKYKSFNWDKWIDNGKFNKKVDDDFVTVWMRVQARKEIEKQKQEQLEQQRQELIKIMSKVIKDSS